LDLDVIADDYTAVNVNILTNVAVGTDLRVLHYMREMPDFSAGADFTRLIHKRRLMNKVLCRFRHPKSLVLIRHDIRA
jgi:hypothetical protein